MRILWFNLATDRDDPILAAAARWIDEMAARAERIDVITMREGRSEPPANVRIHSVGKEKGYSEPRRALEFYAALRRIRRAGPIDVCFAHMMPVFAAMAAPILKPRGVPIVLWYAHPSRSLTLKLAHWAADRVVTSLPTAYPYRHAKVEVIGQGIDTGVFAWSPPVAPGDPPLILSVGRLSPRKDYETLLEAAALLRRRGAGPFRIAIVGSAAVPADHAYAEQLRARAQRLDLGEIVSFVPALPVRELAAWYRRATLCVNLTESGSGDKVVFEALSCGRPCLVANEGFRDVLGRDDALLRFPYREPASLADRLERALALPPAELAAMGRRLSEHVTANHGVGHLTGRLEATLRAATLPRRPGNRVPAGSHPASHHWPSSPGRE